MTWITTMRVIGALMLAAACGMASAADVSTVSADRYTGTVTVAAPKLDDSKMLAGDYWYWWLSGVIGASGTTASIDLIVRLDARDWRFLDSASDSNARSFSVLQVDRRIAAGSVEEVVAVTLPADYLLAAVGSKLPIQLQVRGRRGSLELQLQPAYVEEFMRSFAAARAAATPAVVAADAPGAVVRRGSLGVRIAAVPPQAAGTFGLDEGVGLLVVQVTADSPAAKAGVKQGDVLLKFEDTELHTAAQLQSAVAAAGKRAQMTVLTAGARQRVEVNLGQ